MSELSPLVAYSMLIIWSLSLLLWSMYNRSPDHIERYNMINEVKINAIVNTMLYMTYLIRVLPTKSTIFSMLYLN